MGKEVEYYIKHEVLSVLKNILEFLGVFRMFIKNLNIYILPSNYLS